MDWTASVDAYCERVGPEFWAEPLNALSNLAFLLAAGLVALHIRPRPAPVSRLLCALLALIGLGSFLFHTLANRWSGLADVLPILAFVLVYIYAANRDFWGLPRAAALGLTALFFPYAIATGAAFAGLAPALGSSAAYAPIALLIALYGLLLRRRHPGTARGLLAGALILSLSITARALDQPLCAIFPFGTHPAWHLLNALMLAHMILVYQRHMLAAGGAGR
ncbi:Ceramidase [Pseudoruegeria aquimaris]|uniref:Ceramidase n=1 Tax=Pseudoruegeria aquimaris TaxID=393663 RepID=A0A1Y5T7E9_9RHOB|nr:ceramidase domain-containing protein [Pseudoruegeria aquimaris]SLN57097.1 Ceramidase [Pseudoruegeria aquimaris]